MVELDKELLEESREKNNVIKIDKVWTKYLELNKNGNVKRNRKNIQLILNHDDDLKDIGRLNEFSTHREVFNKPKWRKSEDEELLWTDIDESQLRTHIDVNYDISNESGITDVMNNMFYKNSYHPIKEYLKSITWDKEKRLDSFFIDFLGAEDNDYTRDVTRKMLVAAVRRVFEPGTKFDTALILIGQQGSGKSHVLSRLGGEWFNESLNSFTGDEALMKLRDSWIIELAELSALRSSEVEEVKGFISARVDTYRPKYGRNISRFPRQCIFFGSTNNWEFLKDQTGNRRFFPLPIDKNKRNKSPFEQLTDEYIDQVWSEAYQLHLDGEPLHITDKSVRQKAEEFQKEHTADDGRLGLIEEYINKQNLDKVCAREIWHECLINDKEPKRHDISEINEILRKLDGWEVISTPRRFGKYGNQRGFQKIE